MQTITPQQLKQKLDAGGVLVLDVREPFEYEGWHIPGAENIPVSRIMNRLFEPPFAKETEVIAVCAHGMRSAAACRVLAASGYNIRSMEGGMVEWNGVYDILEINEHILQVRRVGKGCLSYILTSGHDAVVIDPTVDMDVYVEAAGRNKIVAVLDTHAHADHASGGRMLAERGIPYYAPDEVGAAKHLSVKHGSAVKFGSASLQAIASPGHTPGSLCYRFSRFLFTGDTLFVDGVGRPDLGQSAGEASPVLYETLQNLLKLPDDTVVLPAHTEIEKIQPGVPVKETMDEIREIPALKKSKAEFVAWLAASNMPTPNNFEIIKQYNTGKIDISKEEFRELEAGANRCGVK